LSADNYASSYRKEKSRPGYAGTGSVILRT
jgi:hypothetical protein